MNSDKFKKMFLPLPYYLSIFDSLREKSQKRTMAGSFKKIILYSILLCLATSSNGQLIWPGDVNNNGIVNGVDVLFFGIAHGSSGPVRPGANANWTGQNIGDIWSQDFPNGINYAYADCDGNGVINEEDLDEVIKENIFQTHGDVTPDEYSSGTPGESPPLQLIPQNNNVQPGELIIFDVLLGTEDMPIENFYGIAFTLKYNDDFIFLNEWEFEDESNAWYDPSGDSSLHLSEEDSNTDRIEVGITRTNQQSISGQGKLGEVSIVIEDIVFGLQDTLNLEVESIMLIDKDLNTLSVVGDSAYVIVSSPNKTETPLNQETATVFPNPETEIIQ